MGNSNASLRGAVATSASSEIVTDLWNWVDQSLYCVWKPYIAPGIRSSQSHTCYQEHRHLNCYAGHGAYEIDHDNVPGITTVKGCAVHCGRDPRCQGFVFMPSQSKCWRRTLMIPAICEYTSSDFDTYVRNDVTACHDTPADPNTGDAWSDGYYGCDAYAAHADWCSKFGSIQHAGGSAQERCCACGGGALQYTHSQVSTPAPTPSSVPSGACFQNGHPCVEDSQCCSSSPGSCFYDGSIGPGGAQLLVGRCMIPDGSSVLELNECIPNDEAAPQGWRLCYDDSACCSKHCQVTPILSPANGLAVQYVGKCVPKP